MTSPKDIRQKHKDFLWPAVANYYAEPLVPEHALGNRVTDKDGKFEIKNLPAGKWQFMFWQEMAGYVAEVKRDGQAEKWRRGTIEVEIKAGKNDVGKIVVAPELFYK